METQFDATVAYLKSLYSPADLRRLAIKLVPSLETGHPTGQPWDQFNILRNDVVYAVGTASAGQCMVCGAVVQAGSAATIHAAWHNRMERRAS
jgi:hypothetical protein